MNKLALITCIGNKSAHAGPGHSALVIEKEVWSFEGGGWDVSAPKDYVAANTFRPMVIQELNKNVPADKALEYCKSSVKANHWYLTSGVCSSHAGDAIAYASGLDMNANLGFDFPDELAMLVEKKKLAVSSYYVPALKESTIQGWMRREDFKHLKPKKPPSFLSW